MCVCVFFFQAEDGIRDLVRSRGLGDVYKGRSCGYPVVILWLCCGYPVAILWLSCGYPVVILWLCCVYPFLLYTSDAADEEDSVDLGCRRIIKKKKKKIDLVGLHKNKKHKKHQQQLE